MLSSGQCDFYILLLQKAKPARTKKSAVYFPCLKVAWRGQCRAQESELVPQLADLRLRSIQPSARGLGVALGRLAGGARLARVRVRVGATVRVAVRVVVRLRVGVGVGVKVKVGELGLRLGLGLG